MTIDEFMLEFEKYVKEDTEVKWYKDGAHIRGKYKSGTFCPITYVYFKRTGHVKQPCEVEEASKELALLNIDYIDLIVAADANPSYFDVRQRFLNILKDQHDNR